MLLASQEVTCEKAYYVFPQETFRQFEALDQRVKQLSLLYDDAESECYDRYCCRKGCCEERLTFDNFLVIRQCLNDVEYSFMHDLSLTWRRSYDLESLRHAIEKHEEEFALDYAREWQTDILHLGLTHLPKDLVQLVLEYLLPQLDEDDED